VPYSTYEVDVVAVNNIGPSLPASTVITTSEDGMTFFADNDNRSIRFILATKHLQSTSHPGQLSLAIPSWVSAMSTSQRAVMPCGWGVKADMVRVWVAGKTG